MAGGVRGGAAGRAKAAAAGQGGSGGGETKGGARPEDQTSKVLSQRPARRSAAATLPTTESM